MIKYIKRELNILCSFLVSNNIFDLFYKGLRVQPEQACSIVVACVVLHNLRLEQHDIIDTPPVQGQFQYEVVLPADGERHAGKIERNHIARNFFRH